MEDVKGGDDGTDEEEGDTLCRYIEMFTITSRAIINVERDGLQLDDDEPPFVYSSSSIISGRDEGDGFDKRNIVDDGVVVRRMIYSLGLLDLWGV